jgi:hypothetical protein
MPYQPLVLTPEPGPRVGDLIRRLEDHYFRDVHAMLRLPVPSVEIAAGCNFAIAQVLAAVVSGVSVTLYRHSGGSGCRFKGVLVDYYPWSEEPLPKRDAAKHAKLIYMLFRNPLTHDLGLDLRGHSKTHGVVVKRLLTAGKTSGHSEDGVEALESAGRPSKLSPVLKIDGDRVVLLVEAFYWGVRKMLITLNADGKRMAKAEAFLERVGKP